MENKKHLAKDLLVITLGTCLYSFGFVSFNMANRLAEGGLTGVTLIFYQLFQINPAYSFFVINIPILFIGGKVLGKKAFWYTIVGTLGVTFFIWLWQRLNIIIDVNGDMLIAALLAGLFAGIGLGAVYRVGGTTGGADIIGRIVEKKTGMSMGRSLFLMDIFVLGASLIYINIQHMMYTLIVSFVFMQVMESVTNGGYTVRGMLIISNHSQEIAMRIMELLERGVTFLDGEGGYSGEAKKVIYVVLSPREITEVKRMIVEEIDPHAFISVINVHEAVGEGFTFDRKNTKNLLRNRVK